jgi:hypothetical protein
VSALCCERYEFHKPVSIWSDCSKSARNEEPSSRGPFDSGLTSGDSGLQLNLEIALSGVSAKIQSAFQLGRRCVETSDDVIKGLYVIHGIVSNSFDVDLASCNFSWDANVNIS